MEFNINSRPELELRITKISPIDLLAIAPTINFDDYRQNKQLFSFILEHTEIKNGTKWVLIKYFGNDNINILVENDAIAINEIITYFMENIIIPVFQKSGE